MAARDDDCRRLMSSPGVGPITGGDCSGATFAKGRDFGAWLGLVPKQVSTGDRTILGSISKRGNRYQRTLFIQGARAVLLRRASWTRYSFGHWLEAAARRLHRNALVDRILTLGARD